MRALLAIALSTAMASTVSAQSGLNPKAGISFSDMKNATADVDTKGRMGYQVGVDLRLGGGVFLQPGVHYQQVGLEQATLLGPYDLDVRSIHVPVLVGLRLGTGLTALRVAGGGALTMIGSVPENDGGIVKDDLNERQWGLMAGVGLDLMGLSVDLTGEAGQSRFFGSGSEVKLRTIRLSGGVRF